VVNTSTNTVTSTIGLPIIPEEVAVDVASDTVYAIQGDVVEVVDGATNTITARLVIPCVNPGRAAVNPVTHQVYVTCTSGGVVVIDGTTKSVATTILLGAGSNPVGVAVDSSTDVVYVTEAGAAAVAVINGTSNAVTGTIALSAGSEPIGLAADTSAGRVYVADSGTGVISAIDMATDDVSTLTTGLTEPDGIALDSAGDKLYATTAFGSPYGLGTTYAIDTSTGVIAAQIPRGGDAVTVTPSGSAYVDGSSPFSSDQQAYGVDLLGSVTIISPSTVNTMSPVIAVPSCCFPSWTFTVGQPGQDQLVASATPAATFAATGLPAGLSLSPSGLLSGTPAPGTGGTHDFQLTASNGVAPPDTEIISVLTVDEGPSFTSAATALFTTGVAGSFPVTATGFPAPTLSLTGALPAGVTLSAGVLAGTPAAGTAGSYPVQITATNSTGSVSQAFTLTVTAGPPPPPPPAVAVAGLATGGVPYAQAPQLGAGWHSLGGQLAAVPAVAAAPNPGGTTPARPWFIAPGTNHLLYIRTLTGAWARLGPNDASCLSAAAVITSGVLQVACQTTGHGLSYNTAAIPATGMPRFTTAWKSLGGTGTITAGPAIARVNGTLTFFVLATDGKIHTRTIQTGYTPTPWSCLGQPAAATQAATGITYFACQSPSHTLQQATSTATGWTPLTQLPGTLAAGPGLAPATAAVILELENTNHLIYQGTPGTPYTRLGTLQVTGVQAAALN